MIWSVNKHFSFCFVLFFSSDVLWHRDVLTLQWRLSSQSVDSIKVGTCVYIVKSLNLSICLIMSNMVNSGKHSLYYISKCHVWLILKLLTNLLRFHCRVILISCSFSCFFSCSCSALLHRSLWFASMPWWEFSYLRLDPKGTKLWGLHWCSAETVSLWFLDYSWP